MLRSDSAEQIPADELLLFQRLRGDWLRRQRRRRLVAKTAVAVLAAALLLTWRGWPLRGGSTPSAPPSLHATSEPPGQPAALDAPSDRPTPIPPIPGAPVPERDPFAVTAGQEIPADKPPEGVRASAPSPTVPVPERLTSRARRTAPPAPSTTVLPRQAAGSVDAGDNADGSAAIDWLLRERAP